MVAGDSAVATGTANGSGAAANEGSAPISVGASSSRSAVARRAVNGTTLLRGAGPGVCNGRDEMARATGMPPLTPPERGGGRGAGGTWLCLASGGGGVMEMRPPAAASRTLAARSGKVLSGRHSSRPSCQTSDSSVTAPRAALRRTSATRIGPTGTPLTATYQSSPGARSAMSKGADPSSSRCTLLLNAPASAPPERSGF